MRQRVIWSLTILVAVSAVLAGGCLASVGKAPSAQAAVVQSAVAREAAPKVPEADLAELSRGNAAFAFDLYGQLRGAEGNLFYSPHSISAALAMTYAGAAGLTEGQMADALRYTLPQDRLHSAFNALDLQLMSRGQQAQGKDAKGFRLRVANSLWGQTGYQFRQQYLDALASNYGAGLRLLDFRQAPEPSRAAINGWVEEQTEMKIVDLLPPGSIAADTRLVLTNAIYFNAAWRVAFDEARTRPLPFSLPDGSRVDVPMMTQEESLRYAKGEGFQAVELPYDGGELAMTILVPEAGGLERFESSISGERLAGILRSLQGKRVALTLPKFKYGSSFGLRDALSRLGMGEAFTEQADFSGMSDGRDLSISDVIHKAIVDVSEAGTEAAAATAVVMRVTAAPAPQETVTLTIDRPFLFLIRDLKTDAVLFVGRVVNPLEAGS